MFLLDHKGMTKEEAFRILTESGFHPRLVLTDHGYGPQGGFGVYKVGIVGSDLVRECAEAILASHAGVLYETDPR